jgi:hypothetical protein
MLYSVRQANFLFYIHMKLHNKKEVSLPHPVLLIVMGPIWAPWPDFLLLSDSCVLHNVERSLWREDGSCWWASLAQSFSASSPSGLATVSLSRLPQPGGPGPHIYIPQEQGCLVTPPGTECPLRLRMWLVMLLSKILHRNGLHNQIATLFSSVFPVLPCSLVLSALYCSEGYNISFV